MIKLICVGKIRDKALLAMVNDYTKRINSYAKLIIEEVKDEPIISNDSGISIIKREDERILKLLKKEDYVIVLDLAGREIDSLNFAKELNTNMSHYNNIVFVIGGSLGLSEELIKRADERLKLSSLTFLHTMCRLLILEQIYRSFKILNNETYHK